MRVLVTGSEGFIGSRLCEQLRNPVRVDLKLGVDLTNFAQLNEIFDKAKPEVVVHLAGNAYVSYAKKHPDKDCSANVIGMINVLKTSAKMEPKPKIIFASSAQVYGSGNNDSKDLTEDCTLNPQHPYAISKASAERYCSWYSENLGLRICVLRFSNVYGFGRKSDVFDDFFRMAKEDHAIRIRGNPYNAPDFIHVTDVVRAILAAIEAPISGFEVFNVSSGNSVNILKIGEMTAKFFDAKVEYDSNFDSTDAQVFNLSNDKICRKFAWKPEVSLMEGLQEMFEKMKDANP